MGKRAIRICLFGAILFAAVSIQSISARNDGWVFISNYIRAVLITKLQYELPVPADAKNDSQRTIYVLSGDFDALKERFDLVASLMRAGLADNVTVADMRGWQIYSPSQEKNLTFIQWVYHTLEGYGIEKDRIAIMNFEPGFWGTMSEAAALKQFLSHNHWQEVVLVSSAYHTRRAYIIFQRLLKQDTDKLYIYGSIGSWRLRYLIYEAPKLLIYKYLL